MIQVAITVMSKGMDSAMYRNRGETSEPALSAFPDEGHSLWPMTFTQKASAAKIAAKMRRLHPARSPSLPTKILCKVDCAGVAGAGGTEAGGIASLGVRAGSSFKVCPRLQRIHHSPCAPIGSAPGAPSICSGPSQQGFPLGALSRPPARESLLPASRSPALSVG